MVATQRGRDTGQALLRVKGVLVSRGPRNTDGVQEGTRADRQIGIDRRTDF